MKVVVDAEKCIGCGLCANMAPDLFEMQDMIAVVIGEAVPRGAEDTACEAARACPVEAITTQ